MYDDERNGLVDLSVWCFGSAQHFSHLYSQIIYKNCQYNYDVQL